MPVHDWTRVEAGTFHDFYTAWIIHIKETLNSGLLPRGFYALSEQHAGRVIADVLTLQQGEPEPRLDPGEGGTAVADPPRVGRKLVFSPMSTARRLRRTLAIRHVSNHRVGALLEIVSPANRDRLTSVAEFVEKCQEVVTHGCHLLVLDLFPPGPHDPGGLHAVLADKLGLVDAEDSSGPVNKPLTLSSYMSAQMPEAYVESLEVGDPLPDMPLFLDIGRHVEVPLEPTYQAAYRGVPAFWRDVVEGRK